MTEPDIQRVKRVVAEYVRDSRDEVKKALTVGTDLDVLPDELRERLGKVVEDLTILASDVEMS